MTDVPRLSAVSITLASNVVGAVNVYTFAFTTSIDMANGDTILIDFPPELVVPTKLTCTKLSNIGSLSCTLIDSNTVRVTVTTWTGSALAAGTQFSFSISNIRNPNST